GALTAKQRSAAQQLARLHDELDRAVRATLTDSQQAGRLRGAPVDEKAAAPAQSGFIIVRFSPEVSRFLKEGLTLEDVAREAKLPELRRLLGEFNLTPSG